MAFLGLDLGTGSLKALVLDRSGRTLAAASAAYPVLTPAAGRAESDPAQWWQAACAATSEVLAAAGGSPVEAIGVCGQMHGVVLVDDLGTPLRPAIVWADGRATREATRFAALSAGQQARLGNPILPGMAGPMLCWLAEHEPETYARARWALQPKDWLRMRLTGHAATDPSDASATLLYDVLADGWAVDLATATGVDPALLPPIALSTAIAGELTGHPFDVGPVPVVVGAADTAAAAVGTGLVVAGDGQLTVGTGAQAIVLADDPPTDARGRTHCYRAATSGWYAMAAVQNAGLALDWARRALGADWDTLDDQALAGPRADGPLFVPFLSPERAHQPHGARPAGIRDLRLDHDRGDLLRAALEGVACGIRAALEALSNLEPGVPLRLAGGGSLHPGWRQLLADLLGRPLVSVDVVAASARGAALLAGVGMGAWPSVEATADLGPSLGAITDPRPERRQDAAVLVERYRRAWMDDATEG